MPSTSFARPRSGARLALLGAASGCLVACSVINHFDDLKADISGAAGAGGTDVVGPAGGASNTGGASNAGGGSNTGGASNTGGSAMTADSGSAGGAGSASMTDSGSETSAPRLLACGEMAGTRVLVDDLSSRTGQDRLLQDRFFLYPLVNGNTARVVAQTRGSNSGYLLYYVNDGGKSGPTLVPNSNGRVLEVHKTGDTTTGVFVVSNGANGEQFVMHAFDDTTQQTAPMVKELTKPGELGTNGEIEGTFAPDKSGNVSIFASYVLTQGQYRAGYGLYSGTLVSMLPLFDATDPNDARPSSSFRINDANIKGGFAFYGEFPLTKPQQEMVFQDGASLATVNQVVSKTSASGLLPYVLVHTLNSAGKLNVASVTVNQDTGIFAMSVGQVTTDKVILIDVDKLTPAMQAVSTDVPMGSTPGFLEDTLMFVGPVGTTRTQLSILAVDILGRKRMDQKLWTTTGKVSNAGIAPRGSVGIGGRYHVVWTETMTDDAGTNAYDVIWYAQITCI
jgi:hypothetical protein